MVGKDDELISIKVGSSYSKRMPGGVYDSYIMCSAADNLLGTYDEYAARFFSWDVDAPTYIDPSARKAYILSDFDFEKLQLFLLSYFWRCHHARLEHMQRFSVGATFAERIRRKLVARDGSVVPWFDFVCFHFENARELSVYKPPWGARVYGRNVVVAHILNWKIVAKLDSRSTPRELLPFVGRPDRDLLVRSDEYAGSAEFRANVETFREIDRHLKN